MTRKEEIAKESSIFSEREAHGHHYRDLMCGFEAGAQWADETMIEKACEWLICNANDYIINDMQDGGRDWLKIKSEMFDDFKKAMEE